MPLPYRPGAQRWEPQWSKPYDLPDPSFTPRIEELKDEKTGEVEKVERMGEARVYFRPLLDVEIDAVEKSDEYRDFIARYVTGGFQTHGPNGAEWCKDPLPLLGSDHKPLLVDPELLVTMFRMQAMMRPAPGQPPMPSDGMALEVKEMIEATVMADMFWRGLQFAQAEVWTLGQQGKGFRTTKATSDAQPGV